MMKAKRILATILSVVLLVGTMANAWIITAFADGDMTDPDWGLVEKPDTYRYTLVTDTADLTSGSKYLIVSASYQSFRGYINR